MFFVSLCVADLSDLVSHYLHHCGSDGVRTGLQAAVFTQQTAYIHRMQEHLLAIISWRRNMCEGGKQKVKESTLTLKQQLSTQLRKTGKRFSNYVCLC